MYNLIVTHQPQEDETNINIISDGVNGEWICVW